MAENKKKNKETIIGTGKATTILILSSLLIIVVGYFYLANKYDYDLDSLVHDIIGNLIGVLAAFILFDIVYNKLTQDAYSKDVSKQITKTLMGDSDTLNVFTDEDKKSFLASTVSSITKDDDCTEMILDNINKYVDTKKLSRIRKSFRYVITLTHPLPREYDELPGSLDQAYYLIQENLEFESKYYTDNFEGLSNKEVKIGFAFNKKSLDGGLLESHKEADFSKCIFNEDLKVTQDALQYLQDAFEKDKQQFIELYDKLFSFILRIDGQLGELKDINFYEDGMIATYYVDYDCSLNEHSVKIIFHMPRLWNTIFEVTLIDPTNSPQITFDYMPSEMNVSAYSYLNKNTSSNQDALEDKNGLFDISIKNEWIYPKSGVVFHVKKKNLS